MKIRQLTQDDIENLVDELWMRLATEMTEFPEYNELTADAREQTIAHKRSLSEDSTSRTLIAEMDEQFVGYVAATIASPPPIFTRGPDLRIDELYVIESKREQGIATELLSRIREWGATRNCKTASVGVNASNAPAQHLYESLEFTKDRVTYRTRITG